MLNHTLKIAVLWTSIDIFKSSLVFKIIEKTTKKKIVFCSPNHSDILILGPYQINSLTEKFYTRMKKIKTFNIGVLADRINKKIFTRSEMPVTIFMSTENYRYDNINADFFLTGDFLQNANHFRIPIWKNYIEWTDYDINTNDYKSNYTDGHRSRVGECYKLKVFLEPFGSAFLKKKKDISFISSDLKSPKNIFYNLFKNNFNVHGFGKFINHGIKNHNNSNFLKKDIFQNHAFDLCPHNSMFPGYYDERVMDAFYNRTLPITWADENIKLDFNPSAFINLQNYIESNFSQILDLLKDMTFLKSFIDQPLFLKKPNLENEFNSISKILNRL